MKHVDEHIDAVAFIDALFEYLTDSEIIVISMLLEDPKMALEKIGDHLGVTRQRVTEIRRCAFRKAHQLRREIKTGSPSVPLRAALRRYDVPTKPTTGQGSNGGERKVVISMSNEKEEKGGLETIAPRQEIQSTDDDKERPTSTEYEVMEGGNLKEVPLDSNLARSRGVQLAQIATQEQANSVDGAAPEFKPEADEE